MKILFCPCHYVFDEGDRGSELSWAFQIANRIALTNPESTVVTGFKNLKSPKPYKIIELQPGKRKIDLGIFNSLKFNLLYSKYAAAILSKQRFDVIHHVLPFGIDKTFNLAFLFNRGNRTPKIIGPIQNSLPLFKDNIHDIDSNKSDIFITSFRKLVFNVFDPLLKYLSIYTLRKADKIIVINESTRRLLLNRNINSEKIIIIPPGVDCKRFSFRRDENKKDDTIKFLSVGTLMERKGFSSIIKGISEVTKTHKNIRLRILGDGPQRKELIELVKSLSLEDVITFEGHVPHHEIAKYYHDSQIFIAMSKAEGFATVCLEAMASGMAIISSKVGGFSDAIVDGKNGYLIEQGDYKLLAKRLMALIDDKNLLSQLGKKAQEDAEKKYDWEKVIIPAYLKAYDELIG